MAYVDSITRFSVNQGNDQVEIYDHRPGFPDELIRSGVENVEEAIRIMVEETASDIAWGNGTWELERLALEDTTFVAASDDREWIAFGANVGPIVMWDASASKIHRRLLVADLVSNASARGVLEIRDNSSASPGPATHSQPTTVEWAHCTGQSCVVAKLCGITDAGGVVVLEIRRRDIGGLQ